MISSLAVIFSCFMVVANAARLRARFDETELRNLTIRVGNIEHPMLSVRPDLINGAGHFVEDFTKSLLYRFRTEWAIPDTVAIGRRNPDGNYSGNVGWIQQNKADVSMFFVRPDSLPGEPVTFGAVTGSADAIIVSKWNKTEAVQGQLSDSLAELHLDVYVFLALSVYLVIAVLVIREIVINTRIRFYKQVIQNIAKSLWAVLELFLDQENFEPRIAQIQIIWTSMNMVVFVILFGYLLNLLSTGQVVQPSPAVINNFDDLFGQFKYAQPFIVKDYMVHSYLDTSNNPKQREFLKRKDIFFLDGDDEKEAMNIGNKFLSKHEAGGYAFIITAFMWDKMALGAMCSSKPDLVSETYSSKPLLEGFVTVMISKHLKSEPSHFISHRFQLTYEAVSEMLPPADKLKFLKCIAKYREPPEKHIDAQLKYRDIKSTLVLMFFIMVTSLTVLTLELAYEKCASNCQNKKRKRVRHGQRQFLV